MISDLKPLFYSRLEIVITIPMMRVVGTADNVTTTWRSDFRKNFLPCNAGQKYLVMRGDLLKDYKLRVKEYYEKMGITYVNLYLNESISNYLNFIESKGLRGRKVLDVGCGIGIGASLMSGITKQYICLDIACSVLDYASKLPYADVICADGAMMPIRTNSVDHVLIINVINAEGDGESILKEALRIGGYIFAISPRSLDNELIQNFIKQA